MPWHVKSFLFFLATYMDGDGTNAYPSVPRMARESGLSEPTIYRILHDAEEGGWIVTKRIAGKPSLRLPATPSTPLTHETPLTGVRGHPSHPREGLSRQPLSPMRETPLTHETQQEQTGTTGDTLSPDPWRTEPTQAPARTELAPAAHSQPRTNSSPKLNPPRARTNGHRIAARTNLRDIT